MVGTTDIDVTKPLSEQSCPCCGSSWSAGKTTSNTHYLPSIVSVEVRDVYDGVLYYECTNCNNKWSRWTGEYIEGEPDYQKLRKQRFL